MTFSGKWWDRNVLTTVNKDADGTWYSLGFKGGCFGMLTKWGVEPKVGDVVELYGDGMGRPIEGVRINGKIVFQYSDEQIEINRQEWLKKNEEEKKKYGSFLPGKYLTAIKGRRYINELKRYGLDGSLFE